VNRVDSVDDQETPPSLPPGGRQVRLAASVRRNHWWNAPFHLTAATSTKPVV
jgi:hypothetical protein